MRLMEAAVRRGIRPRASLGDEETSGATYSIDIVVHKGAGAYICGEESILMDSLEGNRAYPRIKPPFPAQKGLWGMPTTINNVETIAYVPVIVNRGAAWFAGIGAEKHPGPVLYGISGHVKKPGVYEYPTGMLISDISRARRRRPRGEEDQGGDAGRLLDAPAHVGDVRGGDDGRRELREAGSSIGTAGLCIHGRGHGHGRTSPAASRTSTTTRAAGSARPAATARAGSRRCSPASTRGRATRATSTC